MLRIKGHCARLCVLLVISSALFGCGTSKGEKSAAPAQTTASLEAFESIAEETTPVTEPTMPAEATEAVDVTEDAEAAETEAAQAMDTTEPAEETTTC